MKEKSVFNWSSGKDSALAYYKSMQNQEVEIISLLTTIQEACDYISMHEVHRDLIKQQAENMGLPLEIVDIPKRDSEITYEDNMILAMKSLKERGVTTSIFGDLHLEDLKVYRIAQLEKVGLKAAFPLWHMSQKEVLETFIDFGFKAIVVCIDGEKLDKSFVGRVIDYEFVKDLPSDIDPCGEYGEYHTFVYDGPIFSKAIDFNKSEIHCKTYETGIFWYCNLTPFSS